MTTIHPLAAPERRSATLVCLHSSAASGRQWQTLTPWLDRGLRVHTPDLLGYGADEAWPTGWPVSLVDEAARLEPLLDAEPGGVHLLGHS